VIVHFVETMGGMRAVQAFRSNRNATRRRAERSPARHAVAKSLT